MIIQSLADYQLDVKLVWLEPDLVQVVFQRQSTSQEYSPQEYFMKPEELAQLGEYITDFLCQ